MPEEAIGDRRNFPPKWQRRRRPPAEKGWEEILVENWLVWLGGVALALGGAFLVKLSIDYGLLTPAVRVTLGVLLGLALWAGAEWIVWGVPPTARPANVSQALAAAGAATIFASLYAAYQLYGLLPPALAFPLLALTAAATVLMSLQHGPFVAVLGLAGAFAVPAMVGSEQPSAFALFAYLILVGAGSLALLRHRAWWWLAWIALAGSIGWALLWLAMLYDHADVWMVGGLFVGSARALRRVAPRHPGCAVFGGRDRRADRARRRQNRLLGDSARRPRSGPGRFLWHGVARLGVSDRALAARFCLLRPPAR